jgi:hypothetical protein
MKELSLNILDIAQNSVSAGAKNILISLSEDSDGILTLEITDDGKGMSPELFLTGKDDKYVLREKPESYYLETGKEYILGLSVMSPEMEATFGDDGGFIVRYGPKVWCFTADENGVYSNLDTLANDRAFTVEELKASIASLNE